MHGDAIGARVNKGEIIMRHIYLASLIAILPVYALADIAAGQQKAGLCLLCHKLDFQGATLPTLEGQQAAYLSNQLVAFKEKRRDDTAMQTNASTLSEQDMRDIAEYFASRPPMYGTYNLDPEKIANGESKASSLKCGQCHEADYTGRGEVPRLAGMEPRYVAFEIMAFKNGERSHPLINPDSAISSDDATELGEYFAQLRP